MSNVTQFYLDQITTFRSIISNPSPKQIHIRGLSDRSIPHLFSNMVTMEMKPDLFLLYDETGNSIYIEKHPKAYTEQFDSYVCLIMAANGKQVFGHLNTGFYIYEIDVEHGEEAEKRADNLWNENFEGQHINSLYRQTHIAQHLL